MNIPNKSLLNIQKKFLMFAIALVAVTVIPLSFAKTADAAFSDCGNSRLCVWEHSNGGGARYEYGGGWANTCVNVIPSWNDKISSLKNNLSNGQGVTIWQHSNCSGLSDGIYWPDWPDQVNFTWPYNDITTSIQFQG